VAFVRRIRQFCEASFDVLVKRAMPMMIELPRRDVEGGGPSCIPLPLGPWLVKKLIMATLSTTEDESRLMGPCSLG
jgi:hypothetical protein